MVTWALIADRSHARILSTHGRGKGFELVEDIKHPEGRLREHDLDADKRGRTGDKSGGHTHATESEVSATEETAIRFAESLAKRVRHAHDAHLFDKLVLAAEPRFLGRLRDALDATTKRVVVAEVHKHLLGVGDGGLAEHLDPHIPL